MEPALEKAMSDLVAAHAIEQALVVYFDRIDANDPFGAVSVFAPDAEAEIMTGKLYRGRERIARALARVLSQYERTCHHISNYRPEISGDAARAVTYVYAYHRMADGRPWHLWARILDDFRRIDERWVVSAHRLVGVDSIPARADVPDAWYTGHPGRRSRPEPTGEPDPPRGRSDTAQGEASLEPRLPGLPAASAAGWERVRAVTERDGALPAETKAMFIAAVAAVRGEIDRLRVELVRARDAGLRPAQAWGATALLLLARGEPACARFAGAAEQVFGAPPEGLRESIPAATPESALDYFTAQFGGQVPPRVRLLLELAPDAFEGYQLLHEAALARNPLGRKLGELLLSAINAGEYQAAFVEVHMAGARRAGAGEAELVEAALCAVPLAGIAAWPPAAEGIAGTR